MLDQPPVPGVDPIPVPGVFTLEEYLALPEGPPYYELESNGELVPVNSTNWGHNLWMGRLFTYLDAWCGQHGGRVGPEIGAILMGPRGYIPDLVYLAPDHFDLVANGRVYGVPDLAVEIHNREGARRDRVQKFSTYQECGLPWYWIADYEARVIEEYRLEAGGYVRTTAAGEGDEFKPLALPGLCIPVSALSAGHTSFM